MAQSIYGFQGANPDQFKTFSLHEIQDFTIVDNYRSTEKITSLLNHIRSDLKQYSKRSVTGTQPMLLIGQKFWELEKAKELAVDFVQTLSRDNMTSNMMREGIEVVTKNLIEELRSQDSNGQRANVIVASMTAIELTKEKRFKDALKELSRELKRSDTETGGYKYRKNFFDVIPSSTVRVKTDFGYRFQCKQIAL